MHICSFYRCPTGQPSLSSGDATSWAVHFCSQAARHTPNFFHDWIIFRLNGDANGGAWCSSIPVSRELGSKEWIEVDLGSMHVITSVLTQGRFGNGRGVEFTEAYKLHYWRPSMTDYVEYHDAIGRTVNNTVVYNNL